MELSKGGRSLLQGRGDALNTVETEGQMIQRVMPGLMGIKNILVINDEGHHCYREKPDSESNEELRGDERKEAEKNNEAARLWISGLEIVNRKLGVTRVLDLSATPFFLRGSGYAEGTLFPWTVSDFSLMDAIESGIVKLPRVPVADNIPGSEVPKFRNLWEHIRAKMPKKGRSKGGALDPLSIPVELQTALEALYGHYEKTYNLWQEKRVKVPPCFIVVCQNTAISKLIYDYVSGFRKENEDGSTTLVNGRLAMFRNFDEYGNQIARPRTLLIDSEQLESGDALDDNFRGMAADEIERFRREIIERTGDRSQGEKLSDQDLLREVMNTVGKESRLRDAIVVRAGHRPRSTPAVIRTQREWTVQRRVRGRAGHPLRLHGQAGYCAAAAAPRDHTGSGGTSRPRPSRNPLPARAGLPDRVASGATDSRV
jgi:type III restriction enzyme